MGFHAYRLKQLRARAGLDPLPGSIYQEGFVAGFVESIDPRFYSMAARHWYDKVCDYVATGAALPKCEREAFVMIGEVLRRVRDERDERVRRFLMPTAREQSDFEQVTYHQMVEHEKSRLLRIEMQNRGYDYGPDYELPADVVLPSADCLFDRAIAEEYGVTVGAVKQKRLRWRRAYDRTVRHRA